MKWLILLLDLAYLYSFFLFESWVLIIWYVGFLYFAKANSLIFDYGSDKSLNLHMLALGPWSVFFALMIAPLFVLNGWFFVAWFNVMTLFMLMFGYAGFLILFSGKSISDSVKCLWNGFCRRCNFSQVVGVLAVANLYLYLKLQIFDLIAIWVWPIVFLSAVFFVSKKMRKYL